MKYAPVIAASAALALAGCGGSAAVGDEIVLKVADWYPETHTGVTEGTQFWMEKVEEATNGNVKFEHFPAEQLGKGKDFLSLVQSGTADVALLGTSYYPSELHLSSIASLPGLFSSSCEGTAAFWESVKPGSEIAEEELALHDIVPLYVGVTPSYELLTADAEIVTPEDAVGTKLRSSGGTYDQAIEALGSSPVAITASEQYEAISRGTVDGAVFTYATATDYSLEEVITHGTDGAQMGAFSAIEGMSTDVWEELPEEYQDAMISAGEETNRHLCAKWDEVADEVRTQMSDDGIKITQLNDDERAQWTDATSTVKDAWLEGANDNKDIAQRVLDQFATSDSE